MRKITIEYVITNQNSMHVVSAWRQDSGFQYGNFKNVADMQSYINLLFKPHVQRRTIRLEYKRLYEKEGKE